MDKLAKGTGNLLKVLASIFLVFVFVSLFSTKPGMLIGIIVTACIVLFFSRFDVSHKKFLIFLLGLSLIIRMVSILEIHNPQVYDFNEMYELSQSFLNGETVHTSSLRIFFVIYQSILLGMVNKIVWLKLVNMVLSILGICLIYRIINRVSENKKVAQICTTLYAFFVNPILFNSILSSQHIFLFLVLFAFNLNFEKKLIKNDFARIGIVAGILGIANLLRAESIVCIVTSIIFMFYMVFLKREDFGDAIIKILVLVVVYSIVANVPIMILNGRGVITESNGVNGFEFFGLNANDFWNDFSNYWTLGYLYDSGINIFGNTIGYDSFKNFMDLYDYAIWFFVLIFAFIGIFNARCKDENKFYLIYVVGIFITYLFAEVQGIYAFVYRPFLFICAGNGLAGLMRFIKEKSIVNVERVKEIEGKIKLIVSNLLKSKVIHVLILLGCSVLLNRIVLYYSTGSFGQEMYDSYFNNPLIVFLNFLPIFYVAVLFYVATSKVSVSFLGSAIVSLGITFVNYFKMQFRNDTLLIEDIGLIKEAITIQTRYTFEFPRLMIVSVILVLVFAIGFYVFIDRKNSKKSANKKIAFWRRTVFVIVLLLVGFFGGLDNLYISNDYYNQTTNEEVIFNRLSDINQYISRGCIYSFLNSYSRVKKYVPEGYDKKTAEKKFYEYEYSDIDDDKKVNVIGIMLEAYNDFSKFDEIEFAINPYEKLHQIQKEAYSGNLVTSIFAGGTVDTDRKFLTGYNTLPSFRKKTNSYVRYFAEQGYTVEGSHTCFEWFYNRVNVNRNIGFGQYFFLENKYGDMADGGIALDDVLFPEILNMYDEHKKNSDNPYFSFSVTYQNHGPYSSARESEKEYVKRKGYYTEEEYNILNNYFTGIENTSENLYKMVERLRDDDEPVVLIFFGDHNPWLGNDNSVYEMLDINLGFDSEEGCYNYYCTPYVIWANDRAKDVLKNDFIGDGEKISPNYLMNKFFELAGYEGNEFMKASNELKEVVTVLNGNFYIENGEFTYTLSEDAKKKFNEFEKLEYYWSNK